MTSKNRLRTWRICHCSICLIPVCLRIRSLLKMTMNVGPYLEIIVNHDIHWSSYKKIFVWVTYFHIFVGYQIKCHFFRLCWLNSWNWHQFYLNWIFRRKMGKVKCESFRGITGINVFSLNSSFVFLFIWLKHQFWPKILLNKQLLKRFVRKMAV